MLSFLDIVRRASPLLGTAFAVASLAGCAYQPVPLPPTGPGPFGRVLFLGDSVSSGFENGSLIETLQPNGFANLIGQQAGFPVSLPLIAPPGAPAVLSLVRDSFPPVLSQAPGITTGRTNAGTQESVLAVPAQTVHDLIYRLPTLTPSSDVDLITDLVIGVPFGNPKSQLGQALDLKPTTVFLWIGNVDALRGDEGGGAAAMTPLASFTTDYTLLMTALKASGAHLVVATIPDVTAIPYMTPASFLLSEFSAKTGIPATLLGALLGIAPGDLINAQGLDDLEAEFAGLLKGGSLTPLPGTDVLTSSEIVDVQTMINSYNQVIAQLVASAGGTLVDLHAYFATYAHGITINGYTATNAYLGGLFGLDGLHPTNTGYALIANRYIAATNAALGLSTPPVDVAAIAAKDPDFGLAPLSVKGANKSNSKTSTEKARIPAIAARQTSRLIRGSDKPSAPIPE